MSLDSLRSELAGIDRQLLELVAKRRDLSAAVGEQKREAGVATRDYRQESDVVHRARRTARELGKCVLFSTHVMSEAERLCDDLAVIHEGRIVGFGTVAELRESTGQEFVEDVFLSLLGAEIEPRTP